MNLKQVLIVFDKMKWVLAACSIALGILIAAEIPAYRASAAASMKGTLSPTFLYTTVTWSKVSDASYYKVYIRFEGDPSYTLLSSKVTSLSYKDTYKSSAVWQAHSQFMRVNNGTVYLCSDPSTIHQMYRVKAYNAKGVCLDAVTIRQAALPTITGIVKAEKTATVTFTRVPWAAKYYLYEKTEVGSYKRIAELEQTEPADQVLKAKVHTKASAFKVLASVFGTYKSSADAISDDLQHKKILVLGDSTSYGKPYKTQDFSWPQRIALNTGADVDNKSVSGTTFSLDVSEAKPSVVTVASELDLSRYDIILYTGGINDPPRNIEMDYFRETCISFMEMLKEAAIKRESQENDGLRVIYVDVLYGTKNGYSFPSISRLERKNKLGYKGQDYVDTMNACIALYAEDGLDISTYATSEIVNASNYKTSTCESVHLTKAKAAELGDRLSEILLN